MATAKNKKRQELYDKLSKHRVEVAAAGELSKPRAGLLLWFFSVVKGYDEADACEFICDGDDDGGIDGLLLETHEAPARDVVTVFQSKYPQGPSMLGDGETSPSSLAGAIASNRWTTSGSSLSPYIGENSGASLSASNLKRRSTRAP